MHDIEKVFNMIVPKKETPSYQHQFNVGLERYFFFTSSLDEKYPQNVA